MMGSIAGGRYSDYLLAKHKADPDRQATPEVRNTALRLSPHNN